MSHTFKFLTATAKELVHVLLDVTHFETSAGNWERVLPCVLGCVTVSHTLKFPKATAKELVHVLLDVTRFETSAGNWERVVRSLGWMCHSVTHFKNF